jgi:hypothetical protein
MDDKINLGEVSIAEFNVLMKQLSSGSINECIDLFMRFRQIGMAHQEKQQASSVKSVPPPAK